MTCRHSKGDPNCSSSGSSGYDYSGGYSWSKSAYVDTPDAANYEVEDVAQVGKHLVLKVKYPNCSKCAYEGNKVLVFLNIPIKDALLWRKIDPHFRATKSILKSEAPSPAARFPASPEGWSDALDYAGRK